MRPEPQWLNPKHFPVGTAFYVQNGAWDGLIDESPEGPVMRCMGGDVTVNTVKLDQIEDDYTVLTIPVYPKEG